MSRIDFKRVSKRFAPGLPWTIKDVDLTIGRNEFCVFVGPSGCGKSTLLRMVAGLEEITSGDVLIDGQRINDVPPARRGVAMVFQTYALYPHMTVAQNLGFGLRVAGMAPAEIERKVRHAAEILQLTPLLERLPKALSGGQRQRVAIGRAIVKEPQVFLFDEPLSNLDAALRVQTRLELAKLHRDIGSASVIYVTHDQVEAMTLAQKIVLLHAGPLVEQRGSIAQVGTPMDLYHRPASLFVAEFIGSPKMNLLPGTLVAPGDGRHAEVEFARQRIVVAADARRVSPGAAVHLGVRPEHVGLGESGPGASLPAAVQHVERLGDHALLYLDCAGAEGHLLVARVEGSDRPAKGSPVTARLHADDVHLFDTAGMACPRAGELPA